MTAKEQHVSIKELVLGSYTLRLSRSEDSQKLFLEAFPTPDAPAGSAVPDLAAIRTLVDNETPAELIHEEVLHDIAAHLQKHDKVEPRRVAKGRDPVPGRPGKVLLLVKPLKPGATTAREFVDAKYHRSFDNIDVGTTVARIYPPTTGEQGLNVLGQTITPAPGEPWTGTIDETVERHLHPANQGFEAVVSLKRGFLRFTNESLHVEECLTIDRGVDFHSGDIDFINHVTVNGTVKKDFSVRAEGKITVREDVLQGTLRSTKESIEVKGTVFGVGGLGPVDLSADLGRDDPNGPGHIVAGINISIGFAEGATIEAGGSITLTRGARDSILRSRQTIECPKGSIVGGKAYAVCGMEIHDVGTAAGAVTELHLESDVELTPEFVQLNSAIHQHQEAERLLRLSLGPLADVPLRVRLLPRPHRDHMEKLTEKLGRVKSSLRALLVRKTELLKNAHVNPMTRINILGYCYPGVTICFADKCMKPESVICGPKTLEWSHSMQEFAIGELQPLVCEPIPITPTKPTAGAKT